MIKKNFAIILVDTNRLLFYTKGLTNTLQINLNSDTVSDLEISNREKFEHVIDNFFLQTGIKGKEFDITIIFSQKTTFEKELTSTNSKAEFEETQRFLDMVPFEDVLSNSYKVNKKADHEQFMTGFLINTYFLYRINYINRDRSRTIFTSIFIYSSDGNDIVTCFGICPRKLIRSNGVFA